MDDGSDAYLSRCLKNWAIQHHPPASARARLLETAVVASLPDGEPGYAFIRRIFLPKGEYRHPQDHFKVPITQSHLWSLHIALDLRMVT